MEGSIKTEPNGPPVSGIRCYNTVSHSRGRPWTATKASLPGLDDCFGPINDLKLREDGGGMITDRLAG